MKNIGGTCLFFGIGTFVLNALGREFILMSWLGSYQTLAAILLTILGAVLVVAGFLKGEGKSYS